MSSLSFVERISCSKCSEEGSWDLVGPETRRGGVDEDVSSEVASVTLVDKDKSLF